MIAIEWLGGGAGRAMGVVTRHIAGWADELDPDGQGRLRLEIQVKDGQFAVHLVDDEARWNLSARALDRSLTRALTSAIERFRRASAALAAA